MKSILCDQRGDGGEWGFRLVVKFSGESDDSAVVAVAAVHIRR